MKGVRHAPQAPFWAARVTPQRYGLAAMTTHMGLDGPPRSYVAPGGTWPDGPLREGAPAEAVLAQHIAREFRDHYNRVNWTPTKAAKRLRVSRTVIYNILSGDTWMDLPTVTRIEKALGKRLWTTDHLRPDKQASRSDATDTL